LTVNNDKVGESVVNCRLFYDTDSLYILYTLVYTAAERLNEVAISVSSTTQTDARTWVDIC